MYLIGVDIGGTKTAVSLGTDLPEIIDKVIFETEDPQTTISKILNHIDSYHQSYSIKGIGISCGGPLSSELGLILSPPNLPYWDNIDICKQIQMHKSVPVFLENDANACALAEFLWGAGRGYNHMAFLTFGTGLGAGLILNGQLYRGASNMAGEIGHIRLADEGPVGYHKTGSFEGFCSGGGIVQLAQLAITNEPNNPNLTHFLDKIKTTKITTKLLGEQALLGDDFALSLFQQSGHRLGQGLAMLIDTLNLECIVIGSIFTRMESLLRPSMEEVLKQECLAFSYDACSIVPAQLSENIGDYAALGVAYNRF